MMQSKKALLEALLFMAAEPLEIKEIVEVSELSVVEIKKVLEQLEVEYQSPERGIQLLRIGDGYQLKTKAEYASYIEELYQPEVDKALTQASLETLTIIAYKQPITRAEIEDIRGVNVERALQTLQKRDLITKLGRQESPGQPIIYGTSKKFLKYFALENLNQLPEPTEFAGLEDLQEEELLLVENLE